MPLPMSVRQSIGLVVYGLGAMLVVAPAFAQSVERSVYAGVVDRTGAVVTDLTVRDFVVRENGVTREVLRVSPATEPMQIAVLVDTSTEAEPGLADLRAGLREFVRAMGDRHQMALVGFGARPTILVDYTTDRAAFAAGADRLFTEPMSGSYLLDALVEVSEGLQRREGARRTIVVVTLQGPEFSPRYHQHVVDDLRNADVTLHAFVLGSPVDLLDQNARERRQALDVGASATGGRLDDLLAASALPAQMRALADELENQYEVVYARPQTLIPPETIEVSVRRADLRVHAARVLPEP